MGEISRRQSNIELLRIVAIFLIVMMHAAADLFGTTFLPNRIGLTLINSIGNMGVSLFILISGYFSIHFRWSRLLGIWGIGLFYSLVTYFVGVYALYDTFTWQSLYQAVTPVTSERWWFFTCYIILYCLSPFINKMVESLSKKELAFLLLVLAFFFILSPTFLRHTLTHDMEGKGLPNMITMYLIGRYIARYELPSLLSRHCGKLAVASVFIVFTGSFLAGSIKPEATIILCKDNNFFIVTGAVMLFCWILHHVFYQTAVNRLARYVFPLYLLNGTVLRFLMPLYADRTGQISYWIGYALSLIIVVFSTVVVESIRQLICYLFGYVANAKKE